MNNIMELIDKYVKNVENGIPIFCSDILEYVLQNNNCVSPYVVNEYINRYEKNNNNFIRFKKGIYYKSVNTSFGQSKIKQNDLIKRLYLEDKGDVFGYETGPSMINRIGLTTQVPKFTYFATNKSRSDKCCNSIELIKPIIKVTRDNYKYLQILDVLTNKYNIEFEVNNPNEIIFNIIKKNNLKFDKLLYYATFYKDNSIFKKIAYLTIGGF